MQNVVATAVPAPPRRRRRLAALAAGVAAAGLIASLAVTFTGSAQAAAGIPLVNPATGQCLDVAGAATAAGTAVGVHRCHGGGNQDWEYVESQLRVYEATPMCLDVPNASREPGVALIIWNCHGGANQRWRLEADGSIRGVQSGLCLAASGAVARTATCDGSAAQRWTRSNGADTQPPTPPSGLRTSGLTCTSVTLSWSASTDDVGVAGYDIYHDGQFMLSVGGTALSTPLTLTPGARWGVYVNARDAAGNVSQASETLDLQVPQCQNDTEPPTAPAGLAAAASGTSVTLTWRAASDNVGVVGYDVFRDGTKVGSVAGTVTTLTDSGLAANIRYSYHVVARDAAGNASPRSDTVQVTTGASCGNPVCAVRQVATDTDIPWGLVTLPDGAILYGRRDAHDIVRLDPGTGAKSTVGTIANIQGTDGEGGLMGLAISPTFATDRWLYAMHTSPSDNRIVRIKVTTANRLDAASLQVLVTGIPRNKYHNGGRLRWGPDNKLYAATGDGQNTGLPQNTASLAGKILRINPDGSVPADNPFGNHVWSYGHRNPQGIAFDSQGRLWEQEFGNSVMDETNLIVRGGNYGWPACEGTSGNCNQAGFIAPKYTYSTASASCSGLTVVRDAVYIACARGARMYRAVISGSSLTNVTQYFNGTYGRLRTVEPAPDGGLWLTTTNTGDKDSTANNSNERILHVQLGS
ncbi:PQQ-dependent sugar dehydrogenase [Micromonospora sp. CPCC 206061]|uniref:PQQ-dependent sugar dehydrogenase n=1 Tax=Micromonospora sp. CPCC 206061 TaxID=3122410 RepID=UPI002FF0E09E